MLIPRITSVIVVSALALGAQSVGVTTGDLKGRLRLADGAELPAGVVLTLTSGATGDTRTARADAEGGYGFRLVPAGIYALTVEGPGLAPRTLQDVRVLIGTVSEVDVELAREGEGSMEVKAEASNEDPQRTQIATVIDATQLESLPIDRRSFVDFSLTVPGVSVSNMPTTGAVPSSGLAFRGMNSRQNRFLVDGLDNNDLGSGAVACPISQGAVREFQVITGAFDAQYGRATGGIVNTLLKSGTNRTEGSVFAFYRPGSWEARSPDGTDRRDFRQEQYGATIGGAIVPDKLFYFASAERYSKHDVNRVSIDPAAAAVIGSGIHPFRIQDGSLPWEETQNAALVKLDYRQNESSRWSFRVSAGDDTNENQIPWGGITDRSAGGSRDTRNNQFAITHQWLGSDRWANEARLMYAQQRTELDSLDPFRTVSVTITGVAQYGTQRLTPQDTRTDYVQFADTATFFAGPHTLKAGVDILHSQNRGTVQQNQAGVYVFHDLMGLSALTAYGLGVPAAYVQSWGDPTTEFNTRSDALFLQDDWQVSPTFLVKLGLRYDHESLPSFDTSAYRDLQTPPATVDPVLGPTRLPDGTIPYSQLFATSGSWSSSRVSPRTAFSWQAQEPLRIYGGYGVFSGSTQLGSLFGPQLYNNRATHTTLYTILDDITHASTPNLPGYWIYGPTFTAPPAGTKPLLVIPGSYEMPKTMAWNLGFERMVGSSHRLTLDLLYSRGSGFMNVRDVNAYVLYNGIPRRPDLRYSQILRVDGTGESKYWGQTVAWQWQVNDDLALGLSYTHSEAEDNYTDWNPDYPPQNPYDLSQEWGPSSEDQTHQIKLSAVFRSRFTHPLLKDWTVGVVASYASGRPFTQLLGTDANLNGDAASDRPAGVGRNSERGPAIKTVDLRLARAVKFQRAKVEFMFEVFNLFNTTNALVVQNVLSAPAPHEYGTPLVYGPPRQLQFGVKADF